MQWCKPNPGIKTALVPSSQKVVSRWYTHLLMLNSSRVKSLWSWGATKACRSSEADGLPHFSVICISAQVRHHSTEMGWSLCLPYFIGFDICCRKGGGRGHLHVKDRIKIVEARRKIEGRKQGGWWLGLLLCWRKKSVFCFQSACRSSTNFLKRCHMNKNQLSFFCCCMFRC